ncbi:uncharacterized protein SAPINGB_P003678 [Magnusiomyces paraingens]|uniref:Mitochondrial genome maintenance protein MGM101 n=1 Tax=Magnusiomyces paraingens TaxID=2606893 RepID=A0A5E8BY18_9ASCO|nr:uncharacterized protein SAPINGB_P003678 [Saprochaete ingens]VVT53645.1 unnamed protein product [Saprochaete ingens]
MSLYLGLRPSARHNLGLCYRRYASTIATKPAATTSTASKSTYTPRSTTTPTRTASSTYNNASSTTTAKPVATSTSSTAAAPSSSAPTGSSTGVAASPIAIGRSVSGTQPYSLSDSPTSSSSSSSFSTSASSFSTEVDWSRSYLGLGSAPFGEKTAKVLSAPVSEDEIEIKPDGMIYLPEIKYRRVLNRAFGPGGWGLAPRSETLITPRMITREYALVAHGRLVAVARGEQDYFDVSGIPTATEGCKSNAMMRCCKDLGVASELWDPKFIRAFKKKYAHQVFVEYIPTKKTKSIWMRKDDEVVYPYKKT